MTNVTKIKAAITRLTTQKELNEIRKHVSKRSDALRKRAWADKQQACWDAIKVLKEGDSLWVHAHIMNPDIPAMVYGTEVKLHKIRPRAKLWVVQILVADKVWDLSRYGLGSYDLRTEPLEIDEETLRERRQHGKTMNAIFSKAFK
jgi:hypothetical protein